MKKQYLLICCICCLYSDIKIEEANTQNISKHTQIVDVRIDAERCDIGVVKDAINAKFSMDKDTMLKEISSKIDISKPFALICRGGRRSKAIAELIDNSDLNITVFDGGIKALINNGYETRPYDHMDCIFPF
ncbi:rhodanese-like domain-containing protein [Campylobacter majalis]|uniref:rhodanese-like domain-containing protein n=1 Tax=Campylobacter majalis TaxID=2790656 RepID=UPI003D68183E